MRGLIGRAVVGVAVAAGAGVLAAGIPAAAGAAVAAAVAARARAAGRGAVVASGTWGTAQEVPGTAGLNAGGSAAVTSVSCGSAGNCSAAGYYADGAGHQQSFVVTEANGIWDTAVKVPGLTSLSGTGYPGGISVSCAAAGDCSAGGSYQDRRGRVQPFVVTQANGTWGTAEQVPGTAGLNTGGSAEVTSVSCATARNCTAVGGYKGNGDHFQTFVVTRTNGTWGTAKKVPGTARLNTGGNDQLPSVSCATAGNCSAGGYYQGGGIGTLAFVVTQTNGTWGTATKVPGTFLYAGSNAAVTSVSCATAGNCSAVGTYLGSGGTFVVSRVHGTWDPAEEVPGMANLGGGALTSVSCAAANRCSAGGWYFDSAGHYQAVVVTES